MSDLQSPYINVQVKSGDVEAGFVEHRVLIIAQGNGDNPAQGLVKDIQRREVPTKLGLGSLAHRAYDRFRQHNKATVIDVVTLEPSNDAVKATGGLKVVGSAQESKTLRLNLGDDDIRLSVTVVEGQSQAQIAQSIVSAINEKFNVASEGRIFSASIDADDASLVLIQFGVAGDVGNGLVVTVRDRVIGCAFTSIKFTGGAGAYDSSNALSGLTERYQTVIFDAAMPFDRLKTWLDVRINMSNTVKGGMGVSMRNGTFTELKTFGNTQNSKAMICFGNCEEMKFNAMPILAAAEVGAKRALRLTSGAVLGDLVIEAVEAFGGVSKSSLPYHNTPVSYFKPAAEIDLEQVKQLNGAGMSVFVPSTIDVVLGSVVTTYKFDNTGIADPIFKYANAMDTAMAIQEFLFNNCRKAMSQTRATNGVLIEGMAMTNELSIESFMVSKYQSMVDMALAQGGEEALKFYKESLRVKLDSKTGVYSVFAPTPMVLQLRGVNMIVPVSFDL